MSGMWDKEFHQPEKIVSTRKCALATEMADQNLPDQNNRLPYRISSAPVLFQSVMDQILQVLEGFMCYLADILVVGKASRLFCTRRALITWGLRVVIPSTLQQRVLETLHEEHLGISRMTAMARSFWWPGLDQRVSREKANESSPAIIEPHIPQIPTVGEASPLKVMKPPETENDQRRILPALRTKTADITTKASPYIYRGHHVEAVIGTSEKLGGMYPPI
ncbi:hypothetical protein HOLleu_11613 [Holothuria leucospilota]|uniref:Integrase zinc-binding domain-containing protein n=1 Tax=Holothuria leucospilota TaxID=206669 RepID=A0A9Q1HF98_HOLLE|nr:hypothetical protein HOLleu_11613 [Holothuria leucospilota]